MNDPLIEIMTRRRSVRRFKPEPPTDEQVKLLVEAAISAPSAGNKQPWRFIVVKQKDTIQQAAEQVEQECARIEALVDPMFRDDYRGYAQNFLLFRQAPLLMVPIFRPIPGLSRIIESRTPEAEKDRRYLRSLEHHSALVSVSMALQNLLLRAEDMGLGACCLAGPLIAPDKLRNLFRVPHGWHIALLVALGEKDEKPRYPGRKPAQAVIKWL